MDLTREQEKWLFDLAAALDCPFPVGVFGLTEIEELLLDAPDIREYYLGDGMDRIREMFVQMSNLNGLTDLRNLAADPLAVRPADVTACTRRAAPPPQSRRPTLRLRLRSDERAAGARGGPGAYRQRSRA